MATLSFVIAAICLAIVAGHPLTQDVRVTSKSVPATSSPFHVVGIPVGQGDGTVFVCPEHNGNVIIFDLGSTHYAWSPSQVKEWLSTQTLNGDRSLLSRVNTVLLSHPHLDHYGYLPDVITEPSKDLKVFVGGLISEYKHGDFPDWIAKVTAAEFNNGEKCLLNGCTSPGWTSHLCGEESSVRFDVLAVNYGSEANEKSVVLKITHGNITTLAVGDFEGPADIRLVNDINNVDPGLLKSTIYKVAHHGASRLSNPPVWVSAISAKWAFISSAYASESYGHPKCDTLDRLLQVGSLDAAPEHSIACSDAERNVHHYAMTHRIYSTRPQEKSVCIVHFTIYADKDEPDFQWTCTTTENETLLK